MEPGGELSDRIPPRSHQGAPPAAYSSGTSGFGRSPNKHFAVQNSLCIYKDIACYSTSSLKIIQKNKSSYSRNLYFSAVASITTSSFHSTQVLFHPTLVKISLPQKQRTCRPSAFIRAAIDKTGPQRFLLSPLLY